MTIDLDSYLDILAQSMSFFKLNKTYLKRLLAIVDHPEWFGIEA